MANIGYSLNQAARVRGRSTFTDRRGGLGGGGGSTDEYTGFFKVINASEYNAETGALSVAKVRIVNGASDVQNSAHIAGTIDAYGTNYQVKAQTINVDGNAAAKTYLYMRIYDATSEDPAEFISSASRIEDDGLNNLVMLAEVEAGMSSISQITKTEKYLQMGNSYTGEYAVIPAGHGMYQVKGGVSDIGEASAMNFSIADNKNFRLIGMVSGDGYSVQIMTEYPTLPTGEYFGSYNLAYVKNSMIVQQWTGGAINFRDYYLI